MTPPICSKRSPSPSEINSPKRQYPSPPIFSPVAPPISSSSLQGRCQVNPSKVSANQRLLSSLVDLEKTLTVEHLEVVLHHTIPAEAKQAAQQIRLNIEMCLEIFKGEPHEASPDILIPAFELIYFKLFPEEETNVDSDPHDKAPISRQENDILSQVEDCLVETLQALHTIAVLSLLLSHITELESLLSTYQEMYGDNEDQEDRKMRLFITQSLTKAKENQDDKILHDVSKELQQSINALTLAFNRSGASNVLTKWTEDENMNSLVQSLLNKILDTLNSYFSFQPSYFPSPDAKLPEQKSCPVQPISVATLTKDATLDFQFKELEGFSEFILKFLEQLKLSSSPLLNSQEIQDDRCYLLMDFVKNLSQGATMRWQETQNKSEILLDYEKNLIDLWTKTVFLGLKWNIELSLITISQIPQKWRAYYLSREISHILPVLVRKEPVSVPTLDQFLRTLDQEKTPLSKQEAPVVDALKQYTYLKKQEAQCLRPSIEPPYEEQNDDDGTQMEWTQQEIVLWKSMISRTKSEAWKGIGELLWTQIMPDCDMTSQLEKKVEPIPCTPEEAAYFLNLSKKNLPYAFLGLGEVRLPDACILGILENDLPAFLQKATKVISKNAIKLDLPPVRGKSQQELATLFLTLIPRLKRLSLNKEIITHLFQAIQSVTLVSLRETIFKALLENIYLNPISWNLEQNEDLKKLIDDKDKERLALYLFLSATIEQHFLIYSYQDMNKKEREKQREILQQALDHDLSKTDIPDEFYSQAEKELAMDSI